MEKQVRVGYDEYQKLLGDLESARNYIKELETKNTIIIIERAYSSNWYYREEYPVVIKGIPEVTDRLREIQAEMEAQINNSLDSTNNLNESRRQYERLLNKLKENWIYRWFYSKD